MEPDKLPPASFEDYINEGIRQGEILTDEQKAATLQRLETAYYNALVEGFEATDNPDFNPLDRAGKELERVEKLIRGKFQRCTTGAVYSNLSDVDYSKLPGGKPPSIWLSYRNDGKPKESIAFWYDHICVDGIGGGRYVRRYHAPMSANDLNRQPFEDLHFVVSALAFHSFKGYLERRLNTPPKPAKKKDLQEVPELETVLRSPERLPTLWGFLARKLEHGKGAVDLFDSGGYIGGGARNAAPLMGVAEGLRVSFQIKPDFIEIDVYQALCRRFNVNPTREPHKAKKTAKFKEVLRLVQDFFGET